MKAARNQLPITISQLPAASSQLAYETTAQKKSRPEGQPFFSKPRLT
jgi:hypothetical protein